MLMDKGTRHAKESCGVPKFQAFAGKIYFGCAERLQMCFLVESCVTSDVILALSHLPPIRFWDGWPRFTADTPHAASGFATLRLEFSKCVALGNWQPVSKKK